VETSRKGLGFGSFASTLTISAGATLAVSDVLP
jgi:hypothetical protein